MKPKYLQVKEHQPVKTRGLMWKPLNKMQQWLEEKDQPGAVLAALVLLAVTGLYLTFNVIIYVTAM